MLGGFIARATSSPGAGPMSASAFDRGMMIIALYIAAGAIMAVGTLSRLAKQGLSQISGRRILCGIGHFVLSLSCRRFGASVGDKFC
jgi:predicted lysophospholipase L1 biosynthesis ABC-type transport system permease subunit